MRYEHPFLFPQLQRKKIILPTIAAIRVSFIQFENVSPVTVNFKFTHQGTKPSSLPHSLS